MRILTILKLIVENLMKMMKTNIGDGGRNDDKFLVDDECCCDAAAAAATDDVDDDCHNE